MEKQNWLLPYQNPLRRKLSDDFFRHLPQGPGVYFMLGLQNHVLYVGKAKDLRARLLSYRRAYPGQVSRKVIRLLNVIDEIRWEECVSEEAALLRENHLLRTERPPFNDLNTRPDTYYFVALNAFPSSIQLQLTTNPETESDHLFGAFKGTA